MSCLCFLNQAYVLCIIANSHAIAHDLAYMSETEQMGVINFLVQLQGS